MSHPVFVHPLSEAEHRALLQGEAQARHLAERNRFRAALFSAKGHTIAQIQDLLDLGQSTVRVALRQRSPDPNYLARRAALLAARERAARDPEHWVHLDADEASLHRHAHAVSGGQHL